MQVTEAGGSLPGYQTAQRPSQAGHSKQTIICQQVLSKQKNEWLSDLVSYFLLLHFDLDNKLAQIISKTKPEHFIWPEPRSRSSHTTQPSWQTLPAVQLHQHPAWPKHSRRHEALTRPTYNQCLQSLTSRIGLTNQDTKSFYTHKSRCCDPCQACVFTPKHISEPGDSQDVLSSRRGPPGAARNQKCYFPRLT